MPQCCLWQMVIGKFTRQHELLEVVSRAKNIKDSFDLSSLLFGNRIALKATYSLHIKQQHGEGGVKAVRGIVTPDVVLHATEAALMGTSDDKVDTTSTGNVLISVTHRVDGTEYRFVFEVKLRRRSLTLLNIYPLKVRRQRNDT